MQLLFYINFKTPFHLSSANSILLTVLQTSTQSAATKSPPNQGWDGGLGTDVRNLKSLESYSYSNAKQ